MKKLTEAVMADDTVEYGDGAAKKTIMLYSRKLQEGGFPRLPDEWGSLLETFNGLYLEGAEIYALNPDIPVFNDLLLKNHDFDLPDKRDNLVLGESEDFLLFYSAEENLYGLADREDGVVEFESADAEEAAAALLNL